MSETTKTRTYSVYDTQSDGDDVTIWEGITQVSINGNDLSESGSFTMYRPGDGIVASYPTSRYMIELVEG